MGQNRSIEDRLAIAEATLDIMRLKAIYAECADGKYTEAHQKKLEAERDEVARRQVACFTDDGEFRAGAFGSVKGRAALFENFRSEAVRLRDACLHQSADRCRSGRGDGDGPLAAPSVRHRGRHRSGDARHGLHVRQISTDRRTLVVQPG